MRIVIDLDGVICSLKQDDQTYADVTPLPGAVEKLKRLKADGHYIIIHTARHMLSTSHNIGLINKKVGKMTLEWLDKHDIPYDEIYFGKPYGEVYIDDSAYLFRHWSEVDPAAFNTNVINVVIAMAGKGSRFIDAGFTVPKPLIQVKGKHMFEWALKGFECLSTMNIETRFYFIVLRDHVTSHQIDKVIASKCPGARIIALDEITRGQAETVYKIKEHIDNYNKLLIFNADTFFESSRLLSIIEDTRIDGAVACFVEKTGSARYSFVLADGADNIIEVAEKVRISDFASNGLYYFKQGKDFISACEEMIARDEREKGEYFVIPLFKKLKERGFRLKMFTVDDNRVIGTPEELKAFIQEGT
ncbi:MAG: hypothetical protein JW839_13300 [Candidatus Lokiarchaeota archaeon]|nr:hypothetical protein [Candidatus Lokiarchaeota archaeon]